MFKFILVFTVILSNLQHSSAPPPESLVPVVLLPDTASSCCDPLSSRELPTVYCYHGAPKVLSSLWRTVSLVVDLELNGEFDLYQGQDEHEVWAEYESTQKTSWGFNLPRLRTRSIAINPFETTCLGIHTSKNYTLNLQVTQVDKILLGMFTVGAILFFLAPVLVHNQVFYYITGITVGIFASVLVLLYLVVSLLPLKRPAMLGVMAGGSTIIFYFFQSLLEGLVSLVPMYMNVLYGYMIISGLISFVICYRFPLTNPRSKNLIQWSLQLLSLSLVFFSSYLQVVTALLSIMIVLLYMSNIGKWTSVRNVFEKGRNQRMTQDPRLSTKFEPVVQGLYKMYGSLTVEEYREFGRLAIEWRLEKLRQLYRQNPRKFERIHRVEIEKFNRFLTAMSHLSREEKYTRFLEDLTCKRRTTSN